MSFLDEISLVKKKTSPIPIIEKKEEIKLQFICLGNGWGQSFFFVTKFCHMVTRKKSPKFAIFGGIFIFIFENFQI
jgi:hypothetical protein